MAAFDLTLGYAQWQGSGRSEHIPRGAATVAEVCKRFAPLVPIDLSDTPGDGEGVQRWNAILEQFASAQAILTERKPERMLTAGGDCAVDIAPIDYLHGLYPDLTVIWIDTHVDANTPDTSPSGNLHGMPVSAIMGHAPKSMRRLMGAPIAPEQFRYYGVRVGDDGDWAFQREHGLGSYDPAIPVTGPVHIHFDLDVLEPSEFPHLAYPEPGGLRLDDALALVRGIAEHGDIVGLTITEFAPADDEAAREGGKFIERLCRAATRQ